GGQLLVLGQGVELVELGLDLVGDLGVVRQREVGADALDGQVDPLLLFLGLAVLADQVGQVLVEVAGQLIDDDQAIGLVALGVALALEGLEDDLGEDAVVADVQRGVQAVGGQENGAIRQRQVLLGAVVAAELLVERSAQRVGGGLGDRLLGGEAAE